MVLSFDEAGELLDAMAESFPPAFFSDLNGGILLLPEAHPDPDFPPGEMYIMGEYCNDQMGRYINLYYGSFAQVFGDAARSAMEKELRKTLRHEFRHHIEAMAGACDLDVEDARRMEEYRREDAACRGGKPETKK